jgi:hypothetical protein
VTQADDGSVLNRVLGGATIAFHGTLIVFGIGWTFWRVDEVKAPKDPPLIISRNLFLPPKAEPPPAPNKDERIVKVVSKKAGHKSLITAPAMTPPPPARETLPVQPPEEKPIAGGEPAAGAHADRTVANTETANGCKTADGCGSGSNEVMNLPPAVAEMRCLDCPMPRLPPAFHRMSGRQVVETKLCVNTAGRVSSCTIEQGIDASVDVNLCRTIGNWQLAPFQINQPPVPFCYRMRFVFVTQ